VKLAAALLALAACAGPGAQVTETRMMSAPSRGKGCTLAFVQANLASPDFNQTWDTLGYVTISAADSSDPGAEANKKRVRDPACTMGGTSVGVAIAAANGAGASISYIVLRPKQAPAGVSTF
jgi:hypothetical protein